MSINSAPSSGFTSSEFAATAVSVIGFASGLIPQQYTPLIAAVVGVYVAARTLLKVVHALGYAKQVPDLPEIPAALTAKEEK